VVVGGEDTIEYAVAKGAGSKLSTTFDVVIALAETFVTAASVVLNTGDVAVSPYPLALDDVILKV
jgi:hypothetical protein